MTSAHLLLMLKFYQAGFHQKVTSKKSIINFFPTYFILFLLLPPRSYANVSREKYILDEETIGNNSGTDRGREGNRLRIKI